MKLYKDKIEDFIEDNMNDSKKYKVTISIYEGMDNLTELYGFEDSEVEKAKNNNAINDLFRKIYTKRHSDLMDNFEFIGNDGDIYAASGSDINLIFKSFRYITIKDLYDIMMSVVNNYEIYNYIILEEKN